jgi:predicted transcriptional regulator
MVANATTITPDTTVEEALEVFKEKSIRNVPVVGEDGKFLGLFGLQQILMNLLPKAATMVDGLEHLAFVEDAAPGIAKRLKKLHDVPVGELLNTEAHHVDCDTSTMEALNVMARFGSPVVITDSKTGVYKGIISRKTLLDNLYLLLDEIENTAK